MRVALHCQPNVSRWVSLVPKACEIVFTPATTMLGCVSMETLCSGLSGALTRHEQLTELGVT